MSQGGQGDHEDQKDPKEEEKEALMTSLWEGATGCSLAVSHGFLLGPPSCLASSLGSEVPVVILTLLGYLCHPPMPSLAHLVWIPISSSSVISLLPLVAHHGTGHGNSS